MNEILEYRNRMGMSQTELAKEMGVSLRTIQNWEAGKTMPAKMMKLLHAINAHDNTESGIVNTGHDQTIIMGGDVHEILAVLRSSIAQTERLLTLLEKAMKAEK